MKTTAVMRMLLALNQDKGASTSPWPVRDCAVRAYPAVARSNGSGDIEKAASLSCRL